MRSHAILLRRVRHRSRWSSRRRAGRPPCGRTPSRQVGSGLCLRTAAVLFLTSLLTAVSLEQSARAASAAAAPDTLTVAEVVRQALQRNDGVLAARYMDEAARRRASSSGTWDDPMLMAGVSNLPTSFDFKEDMMTMTMVGLSQTIPYAGEKGLQERAAKSEARAANEERRSTEIDVAVAAKISYFDLFYRSAIVADLARQRDIYEQIVESATAKLRANQAGQDEALSAQAELWRLESVILAAEQQVTAARHALNAIRGADPESPVVLSAVAYNHDIPRTADVWLETAERTYPPLQALAYRSESYALTADAARRMRWPMLTLSGGYGWRADTEMEVRSEMVSFFASLSLPLFKGRSQGDMALSMEAMGRGAAADAAQMRREIRSEILTLHERAVRLRERLDLYRNRIAPTADDAYRSALSGYASNRTSFIALLNYARAIINDSIEANVIANELAMTLADAERFTWLPDTTGAAAER